MQVKLGIGSISRKLFRAAVVIIVLGIIGQLLRFHLLPHTTGASYDILKLLINITHLDYEYNIPTLF